MVERLPVVFIGAGAGVGAGEKNQSRFKTGRLRNTAPIGVAIVFRPA